MKILLLEDNSTDADLTIRGLAGSIPDCTVEVAQTLKQAKELLAESIPFDLALLDMNLPDGNGMELLVEIRQSESNIPVIFLTGSGNEEVAVAALKAGANDYMIKRHGYLSKLPAAIEFAMISHQQTMIERSEIIDVIYIEHLTADIDLTRRHLSKYAPKIHITAIPTAEEALELLPVNASEPCNCKVILIDYRLPGINALEFIKIIRQERKLMVPIILITGQGNEEVAIQALKLGVNEYLVKRDNYLFRLPSLILSTYHHCELIKEQAALAKSEEKYRLLAENSGDVIFVLNEDMKYSYVSPAIKGLRGYDVDEVMDHPLSQVLTPDSYLLAMEVINEFFLSSSIQQDNIEIEKTLELEMTCKDGSTVWTEVKGKLIRDQNGQPSGIVGVTRDISKRREATSELRKLSRAVDQSPNSIVITAVDGTIEYANPTTFKLSGYSPEELIGKTPRIFSSGKMPKEEYEILWNTIQTGKEWEGEFHNKKKNGELFWESATISPIFDEKGKIIHFLAIKKDVTESKMQTEELIAAKEHAEESDRLKTAFLANMSHEIRTPMNGILGFAALLKEPKLLSEEFLEYIGLIEKSGARMLNIINDIVDISKIESGLMKVNMKESNINEQIEYIYKIFNPQAEGKGLQLLFHNGLISDKSNIKTDRDKIISILSNLVKNAIKYSENGRIEFGYSLEETKDSLRLKHQTPFLQFYVKDAGIGIPKDRQEAIFERFIQADIGDKRAYQGAGLGLAIAKYYVEMLNGEIWVESIEGKGSTFYFTLPYSSEQITENVTQAKSSVIQVNSEFPKLKILIVEDDETSCFLLYKGVKRFGGEILKVNSGIAAVKECGNNPDLDLILMDIKMSDMDGYEATRQIRQFNKHVIIIAQTAYALMGDREKAIDAGCNDHITKPINPNLLNELIQKHVNRRTQHTMIDK